MCLDKKKIIKVKEELKFKYGNGSLIWVLNIFWRYSVKHCTICLNVWNCFNYNCNEIVIVLNMC